MPVDNVTMEFIDECWLFLFDVISAFFVAAKSTFLACSERPPSCTAPGNELGTTIAVEEVRILDWLLESVVDDAVRYNDWTGPLLLVVVKIPTEFVLPLFCDHCPPR